MQRVPLISAAVKKIALRTLKMLFWGVLLQGNSFITMTVAVTALIPIHLLTKTISGYYGI